ncbi:MAG: chorismate synthase [Saprospiraceae bacterium]
MRSNSFGKVFTITTYGESHGLSIGVVIDGCPPGLKVDLDFLQKEMSRRRPGQSKFVTDRHETDEAEIISGLFDGVTTGSPIHISVKNKDQKSKDYTPIKDIFRPSHADYTYEKKFGIRDANGGGRSSARETAARVAAGAIAKQLLAKIGVNITGFVSQIGCISMNPELVFSADDVEASVLRCPDRQAEIHMKNAILEVKDAGDSLGGHVSCIIDNVPVGWGSPVFDKLHADLGKAMLSIPACKGFEIGSGFEGSTLKGSQHNDQFKVVDGRTITSTNHSGGIQGGISNGMPITFRVAFKPVSSIKLPQSTIDKSGTETIFALEGRHDPCVVPRAVPIVEAMAALVLVDHWLMSKTVFNVSGM